jgi:hypothetical protein
MSEVGDGGDGELKDGEGDDMGRVKKDKYK